MVTPVLALTESFHTDVGRFDGEKILRHGPHLREDLETLLGRSVDVVSVGGLKERDDHIRREAMSI
jgi:predicted nucleotidyltransferase